MKLLEKSGKNLRLTLIAAAAATGLVLAGCSSAEPEAPADDAGSETAEGAFNQELHDLLPDHVKDSGVVKVAGAFDNPPNLYVDVNDADVALGVAPDLSAAISEIIGVDFEWVNTQWPGQLPGLDAGTYDAIWGQVSVTEERELGIIDLIPFSQHGLGWLVPAGNPEGFSGWESACGKKVGVTVGSIFTEVLANVSADICESAGLPAIDVSEFQGSEHSAILAGNIDAGIDANTVMQSTAESQADFDAIEIPSEESFAFYPGLAGIGISKANPGLSEAIAGAMQILYENGTYQEIMDANDASDDLPSEELIRVNALTQTPAGEFVE